MAYTPGPKAVSLAMLTAGELLPLNDLRTGAIITNASATAVYLGIGAAPTLSSYTKRIGPGESWEMPQYGITQALYAIASLAILGTAGLTVTEFTG